MFAFSGKRGVLLLGVAAAVVGAAVFSPSSVSSQPAGAMGGAIASRMRELEARVAHLELRLIAVERMLDSKVDPSSVKAFPGEDELGYDSCDPPTTYDSLGVKLLKAGCEAHGSQGPCDPAYVVDAAGIKTLRRGCEHATPPTQCNPPYTINAEGIRVIRRECLDVGY